MLELLVRLRARAATGDLSGDERALVRKLAKAVTNLSENPFHPGLQSHDMDELTKRYGQKVFESYLENNTPAAGRLFWAYGPERGQLSVIALEPHPDSSKRGAYGRVRLSGLPDAKGSAGAAAVPRKKR
jgi:hypothetical protein